MKKLMSLVFVVAVAITAMAQEKKVVEVDNQTFDFGTVQEEVGKITHVFNFKNISVTPLSLKSVKASCGCTTPQWSKEPVAPNKVAEITVTYNTIGRPTAFHKSVTIVFTDGTADYTEVVFIKGVVTPKATTAVPASQPENK